MVFVIGDSSMDGGQWSGLALIFRPMRFAKGFDILWGGKRKCQGRLQGEMFVHIFLTVCLLRFYRDFLINLY